MDTHDEHRLRGPGGNPIAEPQAGPAHAGSQGSAHHEVGDASRGDAAMRDDTWGRPIAITGLIYGVWSVLVLAALWAPIGEGARAFVTHSFALWVLGLAPLILAGVVIVSVKS